MVLLIIGALVTSTRLLALPGAEKQMTRLKTLEADGIDGVLQIVD